MICSEPTQALFELPGKAGRRRDVVIGMIKLAADGNLAKATLLPDLRVVRRVCVQAFRARPSIPPLPAYRSLEGAGDEPSGLVPSRLICSTSSISHLSSPAASGSDASASMAPARPSNRSWLTSGPSSAGVRSNSS